MYFKHLIMSLFALIVCTVSHLTMTVNVISNQSVGVFYYIESEADLPETTQLVNYEYFDGLTDTQFGNNQLGSCISISASMLLGYYDDHYLDKILGGIYEGQNNTGSSDSLHKKMISYIQPNVAPDGTDANALTELSIDGIAEYLQNQPVYCFPNVELSISGGTILGSVGNLTASTSLNYSTADRDYIINHLDNGEPVIIYFLLFTENNINYGHAAVCFGYTTIDDDLYFIFHGGWRNDPDDIYATRDFNIYYAQTIENAENFVTKYHHFHYLLPSIHPEYGHYASCTDCPFSRLEGHSFISLGNGWYQCTYCDYMTRHPGPEID